MATLKTAWGYALALPFGWPDSGPSFPPGPWFGKDFFTNDWFTNPGWFV